MLTSLRPLGLLLACALFASSPQAGELAIQVSGQGFAFGDGLLCVGGGTQRLNGVTTSPLGTVAWGPGIVNQIGASAGDLKRFQTWYRDTSGPCGSGFNFSHGITVQVSP